MFRRFTNALYSAVDALAPPMPLQEDFIWHWKSVTKYYTSKIASNKTPVEETRIPEHLLEMLSILDKEQNELELGNIGACMEYIMAHKLLDTMCILATADAPPGMKRSMLIFVTRMVRLTPQFLIPHVSIYVPMTNFMKFCGEVLGAPTEKEEMEFLEVICEKLNENPHLVNCFLGPFDSPPNMHSHQDGNEIAHNCSSSKSQPTSHKSNLTVESKEYSLISSLLKLFCSPDNTISSRASDCLKTCCSLANDPAAMAIAQFTNLSQVMLKNVILFYSNISKQMKLSEIEEAVHNTSDDEYAANQSLSPDRRKFLCYMQQLNFVDIVIQQAHPIVGDDLCNTFQVEFLNAMVYSDLIASENDDIHLFATTLISSSIRHISSIKLISTFSTFLLGDMDCFDISGHTSHLIKDSLIERCRNTKKNLALSMATLQLFDELLLHPTMFVLHNLVLNYLEGRGYYDQSAADGWLISDDDSLMKLYHEDDDDDEQPSQSPLSKTYAPPYIQKILESFLLLVPEDIQSCESEEDSGCDTYIKEARSRFQQCVLQCEDFDWPQEPSTMDDGHLGAEDDSSSESQPEADSMCWRFYEGPFLSMLFDKIEHMLDMPYDINLQVTALVSRLVLFPHPNLHEYLLNPLIPQTHGTRTLFSCLVKLIENIIEHVKDIKSFKKKLQLTRKMLLSDDNNQEPFEESNILEVLIVVEEFTKELAAIAFVKYHAASSIS